MNRIWKSIRQYLEGVKRGDRKLSRDGMLIVFLGGILLYVICLPVNNNNSYFNKNFIVKIVLPLIFEKNV